LASYQGAWHFITAGTSARKRPIERDCYSLRAGSDYAALHRAGVVQWSKLGFAHIQTTPTILVTLPGQARAVNVAVPPGGSILPYGPSAVSPLAPWLAASPYQAIIIPYWAIALLIGAYPLGQLRRRIRAALRRRRNCCTACGYDLRSSADRCPECGLETAHS
jgi:hypothetical protein